MFQLHKMIKIVGAFPKYYICIFKNDKFLLLFVEEVYHN